MTDDQLDLGFEQVNPELKSIPITDIRPTLDSGDSQIESSIDALGLLSVPVLQPAPSDNEYRYRVVDGRRRIHAARDGGRGMLDAYVIPAGLGAEADALTFLLNLARSPSPLREAEALSDLVAAGYTVEALARIGPSKSTIEKRLRLASAPRPIKEGVRRDQIAEGVAEKVANMSATLQNRCVEHFEEEGNLRHKDVTQLRKASRQEEAESLPDTLFEDPDTATEDIDQSLGEADTASSPVSQTEDPVRRVRAAVREALSEGASFDAIKEAVEDEVGSAPLTLH
jgi:ParB-like chromosome segregation protein Spo0J